MTKNVYESFHNTLWKLSPKNCYNSVFTAFTSPYNFDIQSRVGSYIFKLFTNFWYFSQFHYANSIAEGGQNQEIQQNLTKFRKTYWKKERVKTKALKNPLEEAFVQKEGGPLYTL